MGTRCIMSPYRFHIHSIAAMVTIVFRSIHGIYLNTLPKKKQISCYWFVRVRGRVSCSSFDAGHCRFMCRRWLTQLFFVCLHMLTRMHSRRMQTARLLTVSHVFRGEWGDLPNPPWRQNPPDADPPYGCRPSRRQTPPGCRAPQSCDLWCMLGTPLHPWTEWQVLVKILPYPKLHLRMVIIGGEIGYCWHILAANSNSSKKLELKGSGYTWVSFFIELHKSSILSAFLADQSATLYHIAAFTWTKRTNGSWQMVKNIANW